MIEDETVVIKPKNGFGGLGGDYIKPTALANVHAFYKRLNPSIQIIGTGGVKTGRDAFEHILCGASMVQLGTVLQKKAQRFLSVSQKNCKPSWLKKAMKLLMIFVENYIILTKKLSFSQLFYLSFKMIVK